jgi:rhodanese-related sulfurtransferase
MPAWRQAGLPDERSRLLGSEAVPVGTILDIRQRNEHTRGHAPGAVHIELGNLEREIDSVPEGPLTLHCGHGERAMTAAILLARAGRTDVSVSHVVELGDGRSLVVDPGRDPSPYLEASRRSGSTIAFVAETHLHADFVSGSRELQALGATVFASSDANLGFKHQGLAGRGVCRHRRADAPGPCDTRSCARAPCVRAARRLGSRRGVHRWGVAPRLGGEDGFAFPGTDRAARASALPLDSRSAVRAPRRARVRAG